MTLVDGCAARPCITKSDPAVGGWMRRGCGGCVRPDPGRHAACMVRLCTLVLACYKYYGLSNVGIPPLPPADKTRREKGGATPSTKSIFCSYLYYISAVRIPDPQLPISCESQMPAGLFPTPRRQTGVVADDVCNKPAWLPGCGVPSGWPL